MTENNDFGFGDLDLDNAVATAPKTAKKEDEVGSTGTGTVSATPATTAPSAPVMAEAGSDELLGDIKSSIEQMQSQMQTTYKQLSSTRLTGESNDGKVKLTMTATYIFEDIEMGDDALEGGVRELKWRIREAFRDLMKKIQDRTQEQTMSLLQNMDIPEEIRNMEGQQ